MLRANFNTDHPSSYPTHWQTTVDYSLNPRRPCPAEIREHSFNKLFLNDHLESLSDTRCEHPATLNCGEVILAYPTSKERPDQYIGSRHRVLNGQVDPNPSDGRHCMGGVADA